MGIETAKARLYDTAFIVGPFRRRGAIRELAEPTDPAGVIALAEALGKGHPNAGKIAGVLRQLSPERDAEKVRALWRDWAATPTPSLAGVLSDFRWPLGAAAEAKLVRDVLAAAKAGAAMDILKAVTVFAWTLPQRDEASNDQIYGAWIRSQSPLLERLISEQGRQPGSPALEALHALVTNRLDRYAALKDEDYGLFAQAFALAPKPFRERIAKAVAASPDRKLMEAYRFALTAGAVDVGTSVENLRAVGDQDGLFESTRSLRLGDVLELCEHWASTPGRPSGAQQRAAVDRAVAAFRSLGEFKVEPGPALPKGLIDIFEHWRGEKPDDAQLKADVAAEDPLRKARGFYLGHERGLVDRAKLDDAARSEHWPERLVARLADPTIGEGKEDQVLWVSACAGDAGLLSAAIGGTPEDYARHSQRLAEARGPAAARSRGLLEILCALQGVFVASGIEVLETAEPTEETGVEVEDASAETF